MAATFFEFTGPPTTVDPDASPSIQVPTATPSAGGPVDGVTGSFADGASFRWGPGGVFRLDTGGSFSAGDDLATDGSGRAVAAGSGDVVVGRALEGSSGAGDTAWIAWAGQRIK